MGILAPSILSCDYMNMQRDFTECKENGVKWLHVDIMDGHFVPNLSFGYSLVKSMRPVTDLVLDVHLMIDTPIKYAENFCKAGADYLTIHVEADTPENIRKTLELIRSLGVKPGIVVKPKTPAEAIEEYLPLVDMVLVMTVEPGFGGQSYIDYCTDKVKAVRKMVQESGRNIDIEVDGGINLDNISMVLAAGANVAVAGSAVFKGDIAGNVEAFLAKMQ